jgi:hypothetical protein
MEKQPPQKALCLGPDPPPVKFIEFIEIYGFFWFLGLQYSRENRHQSRHLRPTPPRRTPKMGKNRNFSKNMVLYDLDSWLRQFIATQFYT